MKINVTQTKMSYDEWQRRIDAKWAAQFGKAESSRHCDDGGCFYIIMFLGIGVIIDAAIIALIILALWHN